MKISVSRLTPFGSNAPALRYHFKVATQSPKRSFVEVFVYRKEVWKSTWLTRLSALALVSGIVWASSSWWAPAVGRALVCTSDIRRSDAILIENMNPSYLLFERAADLQAGGYGSRVIALVQASSGEGDGPNLASASIAEVLARLAHVSTLEVLPIEEFEPITMNAATQVGVAFQRLGFHSAIVVAAGFRSRRTHLVYRKALEPLGIQVRCAPVWGTVRPGNWTETWHGIQEVGLQVAKLAYYRAWVLWRQPDKVDARTHASLGRFSTPSP
jgi:hypothetical protein